MIRAGLGEPLILINGLGGGVAYWREVMPLLAPRVDAIAVCMLGHRNGAVPARRPVSVADVADDLERQMDALGLDTAHVAGCSLGGLMTLELARRGRARTGCAFSPAGMWKDGSGQREYTVDLLTGVDRENKLGWPTRKLTSRSRRLRKYGTRVACEHGDRLGREHLLEVAQDWHDCTVLHELLASQEWEFSVLAPLPCPITIAWAEKDRVLPLATDGAYAHKLVPDAEHLVLPGIGHVAMFDDPELVADTILRTIGSEAAPKPAPPVVATRA